MIPLDASRVLGIGENVLTFVLTAVGSFTLPLMGFLNSVVYGWSSDLLKQLSQHCHGLCRCRWYHCGHKGDEEEHMKLIQMGTHNNKNYSGTGGVYYYSSDDEYE